MAFTDSEGVYMLLLPPKSYQYVCVPSIIVIATPVDQRLIEPPVGFPTLRGISLPPLKFRHLHYSGISHIYTFTFKPTNILKVSFGNIAFPGHILDRFRALCVILKVLITKNVHFKHIFIESVQLGRFSHRVTMSVRVCVCAIGCSFF